MRDSPRGWTIAAGSGGRDGGGTLQCPAWLAEGGWEWRVRAFYQGAEVDGAKPAAFTVDATPPAEVGGLRLVWRVDGTLLLSWDPVLVDIEGRPEAIDRYVVYRYDASGIFVQPQVQALGETRVPAFVDRQPVLGSGGPRRPEKERARSATADIESAEGSGPSRIVVGPRADAAGKRTLYYKVVAVDVAGNELGRREAVGSPSTKP